MNLKSLQVKCEHVKHSFADCSYTEMCSMAKEHHKSLVITRYVNLLHHSLVLSRYVDLLHRLVLCRSTSLGSCFVNVCRSTSSIRPSCFIKACRSTSLGSCFVKVCQSTSLRSCFIKVCRSTSSASCFIKVCRLLHQTCLSKVYRPTSLES